MEIKNIATAVTSVFVGGVLTYLTVVPDTIDSQTRYKKIDDSHIEVTRVYVKTYVQSVDDLKAQIAELDRFVAEDPTREAGLVQVKEPLVKMLEAAEGLDVKDAITNEEITL